MAERIRTIDVRIEVDTNKETRRRLLSPHEDESVRAFAARVQRQILLLAGLDPSD